MKRRDLLTATELALAASALTTAVYGLVRAAYDPYAAVQWVPVAIAGAGTALAFIGLAALLFVGKAALLLAGDAVQARRDHQVQPPSAAAPLWTPPPAKEPIDDYAEQRLVQAPFGRHATGGTTLVMPAHDTGGGQ